MLLLVPRISSARVAFACALISITSLSAVPVSAVDFYVETPDQFTARVDRNDRSFATLRAGDRVLLKGGTWSGLVGTLTGAMTDAEAQANPALVLACDASFQPTPGGVIIAGLAQVNLSGTGIVFAGVTFGPQSGMLQAGNFTDYDDDGGTAYLIRCRPGSRYMTLSHLRFHHCGRDNTDPGNDHYGPWVTLNGYRHTLQYAEFEGRDFDPANPATAIRNATVVLARNSSDIDYGHHAVRYCYFGPRAVPLQNDANLYVPGTGASIGTMANGWETLRIGDSSTQDTDMSVILEYNTFDRSITSPYGGANDRPGDFEIISSKSRKNVYRYNTFLNNYGQICFRHGDYGVAHGNVFLAGGAYDAGGEIVFTAPHNNAMSGVRAIGFGHTIANNYFYRLNGTGLTSAITLVRGTTATGTLAALNNENVGGGYETANTTHVFGNTFIDCRAIALDQAGSGDNPVYGTRFFNNVITYTGSLSGLGVTAAHAGSLADFGGAASGNYVYSPTAAQFGRAAELLGESGNTFTTTADPQLTAAYDVLAIPAAGSPLLDQAASLPSVVDTSPTGPAYALAAIVSTHVELDVRGISRGAGADDIGSFERDATGTGARPLRRYEVGLVTNTFPTAPAAPADALLHDTFSDSERLTQDLPDSARWYGNNSGALTVSESALNLVAGGTGLAYFTAAGSPTGLEVGDTLRVSFDLRLNGTGFATNNDVLRIALLNSHAMTGNRNAVSVAQRIGSDSFNTSTAAFLEHSGYLATAAVNPASAGALKLYARNQGLSGGINGTSAYAQLGTTGGVGGVGFSPGERYTGVVTIERSGAAETTITLTFTGAFANGSSGSWTLSRTDAAGAPTYTFDLIGFFLNSGTAPSSAVLDNVSITVDRAAAPSAPSIVNDPTSHAVEQGIDAVFTVVAEGSEPLDYQWRKNGADLPGATNASLLLPAVQPSDAGSYDVVVTNALGSATSAAAELTVLAAPTDPVAIVADAFSDGDRTAQNPPGSLAWFTSSSSSTLSVVNDTMVLNTGGTAGRHAVAYFPARALPIGGAITLDFDFALTGAINLTNGLRFGLFNSNGSTRITADASNPPVNYTGYAVFTNPNPAAANATSVRKRTDAAANVLITAATSYTAVGGGGGPAIGFADGVMYRASLTIERTGLDEVEVSIRYSGGDLAEYEVTRADTAIVSVFDTVALCVSSSSGVAAATTMTVDNLAVIYIPPSLLPLIAVQPLGRVAPVGTSSTLQVEATGPEPLQYQWRKDAVELPGATAAELTISPVGATDAGRYDVVVSNFAGSITSAVADVLVPAGHPAALPAQNFDLDHWNITVPIAGPDGKATTITTAQLATYSSSAFFTHPVTGGMTLVVPKDGATGGTSSSPRSELRELLQPTDAEINWYADGTHVLEAACVVDDLPVGNVVAIGQIHGKNTNIPLVIIRYRATESAGALTASVKYHPENERNPATNSTDLTFGFGNVRPGEPIRYRLAVVDGVVTITINGISASQDLYAYGTGWEWVDFYFKAGAYYVGRDADGPAEVTFYELDVVHSPHLEPLPEARTVVAGGQTTLTAPVFGTGPFMYQWFKDGQPIADATEAALVLNDLTVADSGNYSVLVTNAVGAMTSTTMVLTVEPAPVTVSLSGLLQRYTGAPREVGVAMSPAGVTVAVTYNGRLTPPTLPGAYAVEAVVIDPDFVGVTTGTLFIEAAALVRHAPVLAGRVDGSVQVMLPENVTLNGSAEVEGDLLLPGTPTVRLNGEPVYAGTLDASGAAAPTGHRVSLSGGAAIGHVVRRVDPLALPAVAAPAAPSGKRDVKLDRPGQSIGDPSTLRHLTLNSGAGTVVVPPGVYGKIVVNEHTVLVLGAAGAETAAVYDLQALTVNAAGKVEVVGPVLLTVGTGVMISGVAGNPEHPLWLTLQVASGGLTLNSGARLDGRAVAPAGAVTVNTSAHLTGSVVSDQLTVNGGGRLLQVP